MFHRSISALLSSVLLSTSLLGCGVSSDTGSATQHATTTTEPEPACADCDLKKAIEAKKKLIAGKEKLLAADKASVAALKAYNEALTATINDYDKKIATLKNSAMQGFKFVLEGALAVLEVESLVGLGKAFKCLKPTSKVPVLVNGVKVKGPDILKFGLALKDPKKVKMFVAKAAIKGTAAAANDPDQSWKEIAIGYIPLTSAMKLPQRWDEWINADTLIAVLDDAKKSVEGQIKENETSIEELEKVIPATEERIKLEKEALKALEDELAGGMCTVDEEEEEADDETELEPVETPVVVTRAFAGVVTTPGLPTPTPVEPTEPVDPTEPTVCSASYDFVDWDDQGSGCDGSTPTPTEGHGLPAPGPDNRTFPWGYDFFE